MNETCYRYIDSIIIVKLRCYAKAVYIDLGALYDLLLVNFLIETSYEHKQFVSDLLQLLQDADYSYYVTHRKYASSLLTIEMDN